MSRPRLKDWQDRLSISESEMEEMIDAWSDDLDDKDESIETTTNELEDARQELTLAPAWGNCRRGCPESYLDKDGFCSPACAMGAPRGKFVTVAPRGPNVMRVFNGRDLWE